MFCEHCAKPTTDPVWSRKKRWCFCSEVCRDRYVERRRREVWPGAETVCGRRPCINEPLVGGICLDHINRERRARSLPEAQSCVVCGEGFVPTNGEGTCSESCTQEARRELSHRRRAREVDAFVADVNRVEVFKRDDYTCQLCLLPIDMSLTFPHRMSATIDHVLPLAAGGTHEPDNVQAAHFGCNAAKGARIPEVSQ